ncbi:polyadenylate-binding protein-interacting protein 11-like [Humulus lupulus]|uniref:polyadenylate-binding protein-interacting protein 11-like n=1 Tax=Humulus lupulus TaxID=3486 RepID=UPI002B40462F|nr:polyadenylate-binding protein-interacting protein 11-like [Humulus lupulus]
MEAVTEEQLAALFVTCEQVLDCRICGDPNLVLHFSFIEFTDEEGARAALSLAGTMLGFYPVRVLSSKTAIAPVNPTFLPRTDDECEMCARTIYCTNIDKKVAQADVKLFFESVCGEVYRLRLLRDYHHSTRIAFVEFVMVSICFNIPTFNILFLYFSIYFEYGVAMFLVLYVLLLQ